MKITPFLFTVAVVGSVGSVVAFASSRSTSTLARSSATSLAFFGGHRRRTTGNNAALFMSTKATAAEEFTKSEIANKKVVVFSKSYCPYCTATKELFKTLPVSDLTIHELDNRDDGNEIQAALLSLTGQRTVPNVFINGKQIGGNDKTQAANSDGTLKKLLQEAGVWKE